LLVLLIGLLLCSSRGIWCKLARAIWDSLPVQAS